MVCTEGFDKVMVNVAGAVPDAGLATKTSLIEIEGCGSLSTIESTEVNGVPSTAPTGLVNVRLMVSLPFSKTLSSQMDIVKVLLVSVSPKVSVPDVVT